MSRTLRFLMMFCLLFVYEGGIRTNAQAKWVKTDLSKLTPTDQFVIVDVYVKRAMANNPQPQKNPEAVSVRLSDDGQELTGDIADSLKWNVSSSNGEYTFYPNGRKDVWLYPLSVSGNKNGLNVGTGDAKTFKEYSGDDYVGLVNVSTNRYIGVYSDNDDWHSYVRSEKTGRIPYLIKNTKIAYFKLTSSKTVTSLAFANDNKNFYQGEKEGTTFTQTATLSPAVEGATLTYRSSDENIAKVDVNTGEVHVSTGTTGTATITASYAGDDNNMSSTATYTITVEPVYQNIAALKAAYADKDFNAALRLTDAQVMVVDGINHYLQDATGAIDAYGSDFGYVAGDKLNGIASVTCTSYSGLPEIKDFKAFSGLTKTSGEAPAPTEMTIAEAKKDENLCKYVVIKNVTITPGSESNATAKDKANNSIAVYKSDATFVAGQYDLTGIAYIHNSAKQIAFLSYAPDFEIDEDADANAITAGDNATVTISRTFNDNAWNSLVLPFAMTADQFTTAFGSEAKIAKYTGTTKQADGYTLNFETVTATEANTPVFVWGAKSGKFTVEGVTVVKADATSAPANAAFSFAGSYDKTTAQSGDWFISSDNNFYSAAGTESIKPTRAVFHPATTTTKAKRLLARFNRGEATGIQSISGEGIVLNTQTPAYNLAGQRVGSAYKGVVIQNGKKYVRK